MLELVEKDISGGKISKETIDAIAESSESKLRISGLRQDTFEYLIGEYGKKFKSIEFWKCPRVEDLSPLEGLRDINEISWFWNQKSNQLWDFSFNKKLTRLHLKKFRGIQSVKDFEKSGTLREIIIEDGVWGSNEIESLEPFVHVDSLRVLEISSKIQDGSLEPLTRMTKLKEFYYPANKFSTEKYAWLAAKLGKKIISNVTAPYRDLGEASMINSKGELIDTLVTGKRKPLLDSTKHTDRLNKYIEKFEELVQYYLLNPELAEPK